MSGSFLEKDADTKI